MVKVKKSLSLLTIIFLILSNVAFAQYSASSDPSSYEGRPIDESREGIDYYKEGPIIVYPDEMGSKEKAMMERFARGEVGEDEMRMLAKSKFADRFSEMEFQKGMIELKERISRKEAFSYEHEGYGQKYYAGPSYEGYSKEHMIFGMIFEHIGDDIDPRDIKAHCNEPEKIADKVIGKFKEKVGDLQKVCSQMEEQEAKCAETAKRSCSQIGTAVVREDASEIEKIQSVAYSCPPHKDAIVEACRKRSMLHIEQRIKNADEECKKRFDFEGEMLLRQCENFRQSNICNRENFMEQCMGGIKKEDFGKEEEGEGTLFMNARWECYDGSAESHADGSCKSSGAWSELAGKSCEGRCYADKSKCGVNSFSVSGKCRQAAHICPAYPVPDCGKGATLQTRTDANGCAYHECITESGACSKEECGPSPSMPNYLCSDGKTLAGPGNCLRREDGRCGWEIISCPTTAACPEAAIPACEGGTALQKKVDDRGCVSYYCEAITCPQDVQQCPDGSYVKRVPPSCNFEQCPTVAICPEPQIPSCESGQTIQKRTDGKGCIYYYCAAPLCSPVSKPTCNADETLQAYYDNAGCVTSYQCIRQQAACPSLQKPACSEGQSLTTKYDDKGCVIGYECITITANTTSAAITGQAVLSNYDDFLRQCESSWMQQQRRCMDAPNVCSKETFVERCREQEKRSYADFTSRIEQNCKSQTIAEIMHAEQRCSRIDEDRQRCLEQGSKRCGYMKENIQLCKGTLNEEKLRQFVLEEARKRCKFTAIVEDENDLRGAGKAEIVLAVLNTATEDDMEKLRLFVDNLHEDLKLQDTTVYKGIIEPSRFGDIKLLPFVVNAKLSAFASAERAKEVKAKIVARQKVEEAAGRLVSLRDSDVPNEYLYIIEDKASDVLDVSEKLEEIEEREEEKGLGYKIRLFLGMAKKAEQEEIRQLGEGREKLSSSIETLAKLIDEVPSDVAKAILKEQVENLREQQEVIEVLIETKEKKSKGLFGLFG